MVKEFSDQYIQISRSTLINKLGKQLSKKRFEHVLRVEEMALKLADHYQADEERASISALLHDYAKEMSETDLLAYKDHPLFDSEWLNYGSAIWHGPLAAFIGNDQFGITDEQILKAVWGHTIGEFDMTLDEKILFIADYVEEGRDFPGVEDVRAMAFKDLDKAVNYKIKNSIQHLIEKEQMIYPKTILIYNDWVKKEN